MVKIDISQRIRETLDKKCDIASIGQACETARSANPAAVEEAFEFLLGNSNSIFPGTEEESQVVKLLSEKLKTCTKFDEAALVAELLGKMKNPDEIREIWLGTALNHEMKHALNRMLLVVGGATQIRVGEIPDVQSAIHLARAFEVPVRPGVEKAGEEASDSIDLTAHIRRSQRELEALEQAA